MMWLHQNLCSVVSVPGRKLASAQRPELLPETLKAKCRDTAASQWLKLILAVPDARRLSQLRQVTSHQVLVEVSRWLAAIEDLH